MLENASYYNEARAHKLIRALFIWVVLEAQDKECWDRVMGSSSHPACSHKQSQQQTELHTHSKVKCNESHQHSTSVGVFSMAGLEAALPDTPVVQSEAKKCVLLYFTQDGTVPHGPCERLHHASSVMQAFTSEAACIYALVW
jgi:hypothetical protein